MTVLIVTKTTNYELHGAVVEAKVNQGRIGTDVLERLRTAHTEHYRTLDRLRDALKKAAIAFDEVCRTAVDPEDRDYEAVITVGGDGTLLAASHQMVKGGLLIGVRSSLSSVGALCAVGPEETEILVRDLKKRELRATEVRRLEARITRVDSGAVEVSLPVLNDFLYSNTNPAATTRYRLAVGDRAELHRSSGIWVATGAGSTAAILAAGGQKRPVDDSLAQYRVRELYQAGDQAAVLAGGLFDPDVVTLSIENRCVEALLALDGQHGALDLAYGDRVAFAWAKPVKLVRRIGA